MYNDQDARQSVPAYSPADYYKVNDAINDLINDLRQVAPALSDSHKLEIMAVAGIPSVFHSIGKTQTGLVQYDVNEVVQQYKMVKLLQSKVLTNNGDILVGTDAKSLSALINSINSTIALFLRNQEKIDHLKAMKTMQEAVIGAVKDLPPETQATFLKRLNELRSE